MHMPVYNLGRSHGKRERWRRQGPIRAVWAIRVTVTMITYLGGERAREEGAVERKLLQIAERVQRGGQRAAQPAARDLQVVNLPRGRRVSATSTRHVDGV